MHPHTIQGAGGRPPSHCRPPCPLPTLPSSHMQCPSALPRRTRLKEGHTRVCFARATSALAVACLGARGSGLLQCGAVAVWCRIRVPRRRTRIFPAPNLCDKRCCIWRCQLEVTILGLQKQEADKVEWGLKNAGKMHGYYAGHVFCS